MKDQSIILSQSEYERLLEEIRILQARITELTALRDDLVYHVCPALKAEYDEKIVSLERELMAANMYLRQLQRTIEILQAQMNQRQEPSIETAETQARQENKEYEEDLHRKAEEAREFKKKWEESQWSKHDRQEREEKDRGEESKESGKTEDEKRSSADTEKPDNAEDDEEFSGKNETAAQKIKRLYRKIVKRLHPDVHPNPSEHEKDLLNRAMKAFREGDLEQLERIWDELSGMDAPEDTFDDTPEGREKLRELLAKLKARLKLLEREIEHIRSEFPYKLKAFLEDPEAVEEVRRGIQSRIDKVREMNRQLEAYINELKQKMS